MRKENYIVVSFSGGKDSTAMILRLMELGEQIDEVLFCDTYKEFPAMYDHVEKIRSVVEESGIRFTKLKNEKSYDYLLLEHQPKRRNKHIIEKYNDPKGYSWPGIRSRWCTNHMKIKVINQYLRELNKQYYVIHLIGFTCDEAHRVKRATNQKKNHRYPLVEWKWTQEDALRYCYLKGYNWNGLYQIFHRVSCWCCPLQSLEELRNLRKHFPELWKQILEMDAKTWRTFRADFSAQELELRFQLEEQRIRQGKRIHSKDFFDELRYKLNSNREDAV